MRFQQLFPSTSPSSLTPPPSPPSPSSLRAQELSSELQQATRSLSTALSNALQAQREIDRLSTLLAALSLPSSPTRPRSGAHLSPAVGPSSPHCVPSPLPSFVANPQTRPLLLNGSICQGDFVRIRNPREFQQREGIATTVQGRYICVRTPNGDLVRRIERNLIFIRREY